MRLRAVASNGAVVVVLALGLGSLVVGAQSAALQPPAPSSASVVAPLSFEVASVKPNMSGDIAVGGGFLPGGRYRVTNYPLRALIAAAYLRPQITPDFLIAGGPDWIDSDRFDIDAKAAAEFPPGPDGPSAARRVMLQRLLAERFGLRVHAEMREAPVFALVVARADRRMGPQLRSSSIDCSVPAATASGTAARGAGAAAACSPSIGPGSVAMKGVSLARLVNLLPRFVNRVVVDRTGLQGTFDFDLEWTPAPGEWVAPPSAGSSAPAADGPSLFSALAEQLGLKLDPARAPVEILVVDSAHAPSGD